MKKILIAGSLLAGTVAAIWAAKVYRFGNKLQVFKQVLIDAVGWTFIRLRVPVTLKNPTNQTASLRFPHVSLIYKGAVVASNDPSHKQIEIAPQSTVNLKDENNDDILLTIPMASLGSLGIALAQKHLNFIGVDSPKAEALQIDVAIATALDLGGQKINFTDTTTIPIA